MRWGRGNVQVTRRYRCPSGSGRDRPIGLGGITFGLAWFTVLLQPLFMIAASVALVTLLLMRDDVGVGGVPGRSGSSTRCATCSRPRSRSSSIPGWRDRVAGGLLFPGLVSVVIIVLRCLPGRSAGTATREWARAGRWFLCVWLAACMGVAWLALQLERLRGGRGGLAAADLPRGYGAFLCLVTLTAYVREIGGTEQRWDKTEKRGRALLAP